MKKIFLLPLFLILSSIAWSQEIFCNVQVNSRQVEGSEKRVFEEMQRAVYEFVNNRVWSNYKFKVEERIECSILITISDRVSSDEFKGSLNLALRRPVYNSSYNTTVLNYVDNDFQFTYVLNQPLEFSDNQFLSNLTSVLGFYIYIFLGLDFDTFALYGGTTFYEKAEAVVSAAQNTQYPGWKAFEDNKNRYWLVENLLNAKFKPIRKFLYDYHRMGLDVMYDNPDGGRIAIGNSLNSLKKVYDDRPGLFLVQVIMDAKRDELKSIFSEGSPNERTNAVNILKEIDPSHSSEYQDILKK